MAGARNSIAVGVAAVGIGLALGVPPGLLAAARGGLADEAVGRLLDVAFAFPTVLSAILITALTHPGIDRTSTRLNSRHQCATRMPSSACTKKVHNHRQTTTPSTP